jgi:hypothetical protein
MRGGVIKLNILNKIKQGCRKLNRVDNLKINKK